MPPPRIEDPWRPLVRALASASPEDLAGVLEKLAPAERDAVMARLSNKSGPARKAPLPSQTAPIPTGQASVARASSGLSHALEARLKSPDANNAASAPRITPATREALTELAASLSNAQGGSERSESARKAGAPLRGRFWNPGVRLGSDAL